MPCAFAHDLKPPTNAATLKRSDVSMASMAARAALKEAWRRPRRRRRLVVRSMLLRAIWSEGWFCVLEVFFCAVLRLH